MRVTGQMIIDEGELFANLGCEDYRCHGSHSDPSRAKDEPICTVCCEVENMGWTDVLGIGSPYSCWNDASPDYKWLIEEGIFLGQELTLEVNVAWHHDSYTGESDSDIDWGIVWRGPVTQQMIDDTLEFITQQARAHDEQKDRAHAREVSNDIVCFRWKSKGRIKQPIDAHEAKRQKERRRGW